MAFRFPSFLSHSFSRVCLSACVIYADQIFLLRPFVFPLFFPSLSLVSVFLPVPYYADLSSPASSWTALVSQSFSRVCLSACAILCRSFFSCFFVDRFSFPVFLSCVFLPVSFYADLSSPASSWTALVSQSFSRVSFCLCHFMPTFLLLLLRGPL